MLEQGRPIVLAATRSESTEYLKSAWRQMLLATIPHRYARLIGSDWSLETEVRPDGQALYVPNGLRVVESLLCQAFPEEWIAVCYPEQLHRFVGPETKVVGVHAHNPLGITFATDVYAKLYGADLEPINAAQFRFLMEHPILSRHRHHLKLIVGGPGAWQIAHKGMQDPWGIDCLVEGEAEEHVVDLFDRAVRGETLPRRVFCESPSLESIPVLKHRATYGVVEITRGCGRGCQFCSVNLRRGQSFPLEHILRNVEVQTAEGADTIMLTTEDLFLYQHGPGFQPNRPALKQLLESVAAVPGVRHVLLTHGTITPAVLDPGLVEELSPVAVGKSVNRHPASTHPEHRFAMMFVGLETGSVRLFKKYMKGKSYPFRPEQWPDVVLKGIEIMNRNNWFPLATCILGLPDEQPEDTKQSLELLYSLQDAKWCVIPTLFTPLVDTRLGDAEGAKLYRLTDLQWEFFFTCWRYNMDFFRNSLSERWKFGLGVPIYYSLIGRRLFGKAMKYPLLRLAHVPERWMRGKLYLDFSDPHRPRLRPPDALRPPERLTTTTVGDGPEQPVGWQP
ncbi:MAG TPA: radical SAM protein [Acidobacteriota bacterium]|nr:radical SAM protein [Acidobacteriota bacterium]